VQHYRVRLVVVLTVGLATACAAPSDPSGTSTVDASTSMASHASRTARASVRPQPSRAASTPNRVGFETSLGWCGPQTPLPGVTVEIDFEPDGVHPTCTSLGPNQHLLIVNKTNKDGYTGSALTVVLPGESPRLLAPGDQIVLPRIGDPAIHEMRTAVTFRSDLNGLGDARATIWRVNSKGIAY